MPTTSWFNRMERRVRAWFSKRPILYGFIAGVGVVLFWRGVWHTADAIATYAELMRSGNPTTDFAFPWDGPVSILVGSILLLASGLFVSTFLGSEITISGLRGERKLAEKTEFEVRTETGAIHEIRAEVRKIRERLDKLDGKTKEKAAETRERIDTEVTKSIL